MAINKKLIHFQKLSTFKELLAANNILDTSIVFIKDSQQIWTHGLYYSIADAPADNNSYVRKNNGWVLAPSSGIEIYIGEDLPSSDYKVWVDTRDGSLYYYNNEWKELFTGTPIDLSMVDIYGNTRASATTANCYVVKEARVYRIPLVYGNAIVNGSINSAAYTRIDNYYAINFVNGNGTEINTPFIEKQVTIRNALLSIADTDKVFSDIDVVSNPNVTSINDCGYILFKVKAIPDTGANGIISVKDNSGNIVWNWHIWVWTDDLTTKAITNKTGVTYNILPYNLASKWDDSSKTHLKNWFYQWGRSVPTLGPSKYNENTTHESYGGLTFALGIKPHDYYEGILNPTIFYNGGGDYSYKYNWFGSHVYYNVWDANCTTTGTSDNVTVKTVYDPCPPGFKIPNGKTFTGFNSSNGGSWSDGYTWSGTFFPNSGFRTGGTYGGALSFNYSLYWTSAVEPSELVSLEYIYSLLLYNGGVAPLSSVYGDYGGSIRPVTEL